MSAPADERWMRAALTLGARGLGQSWPNPSVGALIVRDGRLVGRGVTQPGGRPHAERMALDMAGPAARGATAYVTLEPCAHQGQTAPCSTALITAGITRVVTAASDPDPRVSGRGHAALRAAGITVTEHVCAAEGEEAHQGFFTRIRQGRPWLTLKLATSLDGRIATASGESRWITGPDARRDVHLLRARHDAVLVGGGTARADDPDLTVRDLGIGHQPVRIVAARRLDLPETGRLAQTAGDPPLWLCHAPGAPASAWQERGARTFDIPLDGQGLDVRAMMAALGGAGLTRVLCEGGGRLAASLLDAGLVDEVVLYTAGLAIGGDGRAAIAGLAGHELSHLPRFERIDCRPLGQDIRQRWRPLRPA